MGILSKIFSRKPRTKQAMMDTVQAAYHSAASETEHMDFSWASGVGFNKALQSDILKLRSRIRYELRNNGIAKGIQRTYANGCVGTGPKLSIESEDENWNKELEHSFAEWSRSCGWRMGESLGELTFLGVMQYFPTGEYFHIAHTESDSDHPVKLRFESIRPDRVDTPYNQSENLYRGIEHNGAGKPTAYYIAKHDPDVTDSHITEYIRTPRNKVIHSFRIEDPAQLRGVPWLAIAIPELHKLRRYDEAKIAAAIVAAKVATVLTTNNPDMIQDPAEIIPPGVLDISDGQILVPPPGYDLRGFSPTQPNTNDADFRRSQIASAGAGVGMPANIATQDSSGSNFASARYDGVAMEIDFDVTHMNVESQDLNRKLKMYIREAESAGLIGPAPDSYIPRWRWPKKDRHTDPQKAANAKKTRTSTGQITMSGAWAEDGHDAEDTYRELLREVRRWEADGLKHPLSAQVAQENDNARTD